MPIAVVPVAVAALIVVVAPIVGQDKRVAYLASKIAVGRVQKHWGRKALRDFESHAD